MNPRVKMTFPCFIAYAEMKKNFLNAGTPPICLLIYWHIYYLFTMSPSTENNTIEALDVARSHIENHHVTLKIAT